jgi:ketosteroid isomerase-like protein
VALIDTTLKRRLAAGLAICATAALALTPARAQDPAAPTASEFQRLVDEYGRLWTMPDGGAIDLTRLDRFYAPDADVTIVDFVPPGISRGWAEHREGLQRELFSQLRMNSYVPRQDVTVKPIAGGRAVVTTFTFDYANRVKDGSEAKITGRQTNVWERRDGRWVIVHEHGSPVPSAAGEP